MKHWPLSFVACAVAASIGCEISLDGRGVVVREERRFQLSGAPDLALTTFDGSIRVESWARNEIRIEIEKRGSTPQDAERLEVRATQDGNRIRVEAPNPSSRPRRRFGNIVSDSVSFIVTTPRALALRAETGDGAITVRDLAGRIELHSGDGGIRAASVTGDLLVDTGDGPIDVSGMDGRVELTSGDGSIEVRGQLDVVRAETGDGPITALVDRGSVAAEDWTIRTGDGSIALELPQGFNAELDASTNDGRVSAEGATTTGSPRGEGDPHVLRGRLGAGGRTLRLTTGDGPIAIRTR
jgi:DUF4097 and DUF4098 domain-containing protein YvlB